MKNILYLIAFTFVFASCNNDDYLKDGGISSPYVNMTTYDYLRSNPLFDTLVMAIDKAGLKDAVNGDITFYVPTNYSIQKYVTAVQTYRRGGGDGYDETAVYTFDSIPAQVLHDSLQMYMFSGKITRDSMKKDGDIYTSLIGTEAKLSKEPEKLFTDILTDPVDILYFIRRKGERFDSYDEKDNVASTEKDMRVRVQTSGLISTTGIIHVLNNAHTMFFFQDKN